MTVNASNIFDLIWEAQTSPIVD